VWSPDGKYIVFARAEAKDSDPVDQKSPLEANDPNEVQIKYSLYRIPFNGGRGGRPVPIAGASNNGMSNNFPKISPDGRWIVFVRCRNGQLMRPDSELYIVPSTGGKARRMRCNTSRMNSWHSFSPNGRWMVFSSKSRSAYTQMYLTHIDANGIDSPPIYIENSTAANRAVNIPEFVNTASGEIESIDSPASDYTASLMRRWICKRRETMRQQCRNGKKPLTQIPRLLAPTTAWGSFWDTGEIRRGYSYFQRATRSDGNFFEAYYNLGIVFTRMSRLTDAIDAWRNTIRLRPGFAQGMRTWHSRSMRQASSRIRSRSYVWRLNWSPINCRHSTLPRICERHVRILHYAMARKPWRSRNGLNKSAVEKIQRFSTRCPRLRPRMGVIPRQSRPSRKPCPRGKTRR